jgi:hypothetical protein
MFNQFNRAGHRMLSAEISSELVALGKRHGLDLSVGGGSIGGESLTIKVVATSTDKTAVEAAAKRKIDFEGRFLGLTGEDYGTVFTTGRDSYRFTGVSGGRPKYPISAERVYDGKGFKFPRYVAQQIIAARKPAAVQTQATDSNRSPSPSPSHQSQDDDRYADLAQF